MQVETLSSTSFLSAQNQISKTNENQIDKNSLEKSSFEQYDETKQSNASSSQEEYKDQSNNIKEQLNASASLTKAFLHSL